MTQIELKVNGRVYRHFARINIDYLRNTVGSTFEFDGFFERDVTGNLSLFEPLSYPGCEVFIVDDEAGINEKILTGVILNHDFVDQRQPNLTRLSGYSTTGVLQDCQIPLELYPLQQKGQSLTQITKRITDFFGLKLSVFDNAKQDANKPFESVKAEFTETCSGFIAKLARQRNITLSHDHLGRVLLFKVTGNNPPRVKIDQSDLKVISINFSVVGNGIHSDITAMRQAKTGSNVEGKTTIKNPLYQSSKRRPKVITLSNGDDNDTEKAATAAVCAEAKNLPVTITIEGWTFNNTIVRAGFYIEVNAPDIFINTTKLIIESIKFTSEPKRQKIMIITAVLPSVYTGELPKKNPFK